MTIDKRKSIPTPGEHLGFEVGDDRKLAGWAEIVDYFKILDESSERVRTLEIGRSTKGNPFLMAICSSPQNLAELDEFRGIQARLADARTIADDAEAERLISRGRVVVAITCSIHATEVGATQMSLLLAHRLATCESDEVRQILDNAIVLLLPSLNPDGLVDVKTWYESTLGESYEGVMPPFLYQHYTGHDNNRDWFMFTQQETRLVVDHCLNAWHPHVALDMHQTRSNGMRMILPPFVDPVGPNVHPILTAETAMLGSAMAAELTAQGKAGVSVNVVYDSYSPNRTYQQYHGGIRLLSEAAGARIATPVNVPERDLQSDRGETPTQETWNHPMPWRGGTWRLRDIVEYDFEAAMGCLRHSARLREMLVSNFYKVGRDAVEDSGSPYAFVVPTQQHDMAAAAEMLDALRMGMVEIHEATAAFSADGEPFAAGARVILRGQPYWAYAKTLLEQNKYPELLTHPGGPPKAPYDVTAHCLPIQMGVNTYTIRGKFAAQLRLLGASEPAMPVPMGGGSTGSPRTRDTGLPRTRSTGSPRARDTGSLRAGSTGLPRTISTGSARAGDREGQPRMGTGRLDARIIPPESNAAARLVNRLLAAGVPVSRTKEPLTLNGVSYGRGAFVVEDGKAFNDVVRQAHHEREVQAHHERGLQAHHEREIGKYNHERELQAHHEREIGNSNHERELQAHAERGFFELAQVVEGLPNGARHVVRKPRIGVYKSYLASVEEGWTRYVLDEYGFEYVSLTDGEVREGGLSERFDAIALPHQAVWHLHRGHRDSYYHPSYSGGLGDEGASRLREFVEQGGTLVTWDGSSRYAIRHLELPVRNVLADMKRADFYAPGSLLAVLLDAGHPIAYGMPRLAAVMFYDSPAFDIRRGRVIGKYPLRNPLFSGMLIGPEKLYNRTALASVPLGKGEVILFGFRPHFRAQARGTYKLLFNALYGSAYEG